ncbi:AMP-binding protein [Salicibibacter kimchii]|nr:AMP-binding protein [Salicibibacter kimchii]
MLEKTIDQVFDKLVTHHRDKIALNDSDRSITYLELGNEVNKLANLLQTLDIKVGDRVALWMENSIEFVVAEFAIAKIGAVRVPMNTYLNKEEVLYRIHDSHSKLLIYHQSLLENQEKLPIEHKCITLNETVLKEKMANVSTSYHKPQINPDSYVTIMYTGGTTGKSKGVLHTHKTILSIVYSETYELEIERGAILLHTTPLPHSAGYFIMPGMLRGGEQYIEKGFDPRRFCEIVENKRITFAFLVPTMIYMLLDYPHLKQYDLNSLNTIVYGAAPMAQSRVKDAIETFGPILTQIYSQAEIINQTTVLTKKEHEEALNGSEHRLSSCGRSIIMSEVQIVNERDEACAPNQVGELITKGPHMMISYWNLPEETDDTIKEGWIYTGDMAYQDEYGYIYLVDRKKDMIITGGFNVYTTAVEKVLFEHETIKQATVIGVPDEKWGESIKAFVVSHSENITEAEIINHCKTKLAKYEVPKSIEFIKELPLTPYGKIDKKLLRKAYWQNSNRQVN